MTTLTAPDLPAATLETLTRIFGAYPELLEVKLFGSRATGKASPRSDIDLATFGIADEYRLGRLALDLDDANIPQKCALVAYETIRYAPFKSHIDAFGIAIYRKRPLCALRLCVKNLRQDPLRPSVKRQPTLDLSPHIPHNEPRTPHAETPEFGGARKWTLSSRPTAAA